jgi:hypothetical protein
MRAVVFASLLAFAAAGCITIGTPGFQVCEVSVSCYFVVYDMSKTAASPYFMQGSTEAYTIGGNQNANVNWTVGKTCSFVLQNSQFYPFYLTTSIIGGGLEPYTTNVTVTGQTGGYPYNSPLFAGAVLNITALSPISIYYGCNQPGQAYMGGAITVLPPPVATSKTSAPQTSSSASDGCSKHTHSARTAPAQRTTNMRQLLRVHSAALSMIV